MTTNPLELLFRPTLKGVGVTETLSGPSQWAGRTLLQSGDATVTVSTALVNSDSLIWYGIDANVDQSSGVSAPIEVRSLTSGSWFSFATADGTAVVRDTTIMWMLFKAS